MEKSVLLLVDLEGIIGIQNLGDDKHCNDVLIDELSYVINILHKHEFHEITICNIHNAGKLLDDRNVANLQVTLLKGVKSLADQECDYKFAFLLGFHGMTNAGGRFGHTFRYDFENLIFKGMSIGEVGLYTRWLESSGVPVLLVSGEGNFKDELIPRGTEIHLVDSIQKNSIQLYYESLGVAIEACLRRKLRKPHKIANGIVELEIDNPDKYSILSANPYDYLVVDQKFIFPSIDDFFKNLHDFAVSLNKATGKIVQENKEIAKEINHLGIKNEFDDLAIMNIFSTPIDQIDHSARTVLKDMIRKKTKDN